jgi:putative transposase
LRAADQTKADQADAAVHAVSLAYRRYHCRGLLHLILIHWINICASPPTGSEGVKTGGELHHLWRAVNHEGVVLKSFVARGRDKLAALMLLKKPMRRQRVPNALGMDGLRSYARNWKPGMPADWSASE